MEAVIIKELKGFTVHYVFANGDAILSKRNKLFLYQEKTDRLEHIIRLSYRRWWQNLPWPAPVIRLLRAEVYHVLARNPNDLVVFFDGRIFRIQNKKIVNIFTIPTCRRPINVYFDGNNTLIWGDYHGRQLGRPIHIYRSTDFGGTWERIFSFPAFTIKHVHNIIYDPYRKHFWILTGDKDEESGLWKTKDFKQVTPFVHGRQAYRAVSLIVEKEGLIIPSDTASETNYIRFYSFSAKALTELQKLNGSAMFAKKIGQYYFVSTMYEPSVINNHPYAELLGSQDGRLWQKLIQMKKDLLPVRYFQYPLIQFPEYEEMYLKNIFLFSVRSVKGGKKTWFVQIS